MIAEPPAPPRLVNRSLECPSNRDWKVATSYRDNRPLVLLVLGKLIAIRLGERF
jgi:hypothetical protein